MKVSTAGQVPADDYGDALFIEGIGSQKEYDEKIIKAVRIIKESNI